MDNKLCIGKHIAELRKQKGITQETLAEVVGVSGQAVSKWESGGSPDIELLQPIADYFNVSIDRLFGRTSHNFANVEANIVEYINQSPKTEERMRRAFELCWTIEFGMFGRLENAPDMNKTWGSHSSVLCSSGITSLNMREAQRYFLIMPQPEAGWGKTFYYTDEYRDMLTALSDEETLKAVFFLYARDAEKAFTPTLLETHLGIKPEKAMIILEWLKKHKLASTTEIELDDDIKVVYNFKPNPSFLPFLAFLGEMIRRPNSFYCHQGGLNKYL